MSVTYRQYLDFLERLEQTLDDLTALMKKQTAAVMQGDLTRVDECMRKEQALSLTLRALDKKREDMLGALGLSGIPLSKLQLHCPEEFRAQTKQTVERLQGRYEVYRSASEVSRTTLECNLHQIETIMKEEPGDMPPAGTLADIRA